ncbi:MAG TPA: peptidylprolyl isomerase [Sulfuriferula sp.]|nr:peptidylprolyl isomerase [Sulfuriferula sp.]
MLKKTVANNKVVYLTYSIIDQNGAVFEQYDVPIGYVHGANSGLFEKIEATLAGHEEGERVEVVLTPADGFGHHQPELTFTDSIDNVPPQFRHVGAAVSFENDAGESKEFRVTKIEDGKLTVDGNHPLAGQTVRFIVNIVDIRDATAEEIANGRPEDASAPRLH